MLVEAGATVCDSKINELDTYLADPIVSFL